MKIAVLGTGGVGGYFGGMLARAGEEVWFVARGAHLDAMRRHGLTIIDSEERFHIPPGRMTDRPEEIGPCDTAIVCVKSYDTAAVAPLLAKLLHPGTLVVTLQNGVDNAEILQRLLPGIGVYGGLVYLYATITGPAEVTRTGGPQKVIFGPFPGGAPGIAPAAALLYDRMIHAGINAVLSADIRTDIWKKFIFIAAVGPITALTRLTLGEILAVGETCRMLEEAMREAIAVAGAAGITIDGGFLDGVFAALRRFDNATRSSMHYDLTHGKPLEIEAFSGTLVRLGRTYRIPTPVHALLFAALLPHHLAALRSSTHSPEGAHS